MVVTDTSFAPLAYARAVVAGERDYRPGCLLKYTGSVTSESVKYRWEDKKETIGYLRIRHQLSKVVIVTLPEKQDQEILVA